ncbi:hypothetical protein BVG93_07785 [Serratia marcescens]|nr:hypothetical protein BVG93_07785 [Serratia marcescens]
MRVSRILGFLFDFLQKKQLKSIGFNPKIELCWYTTAIFFKYPGGDKATACRFLFLTRKACFIADLFLGFVEPAGIHSVMPVNQLRQQNSAGHPNPQADERRLVSYGPIKKLH